VSGTWRIRQHRHGIIQIPVVIHDGGGQPDPQAERAPDGITFHYRDGKVVIYPWNSIVEATYTPDEQKGTQ
jgi:hypothetical protein